MRILRDALVVVLGVALLAVGAEAALRAVFSDRVPPLGQLFKFRKDTPYILPNKEYITELRKNHRFRYSGNPGYRPVEHDIRIDSRGFRGRREVDFSRPRIIVYGDSNIFAIFSKEENTFPRKLQAYLRERYFVINAGIPGAGPDQSVLRLEEDIGDIRPAIVVLHVFAENDFGDIVRNGLFRLEGGRLTRVERTFDDPAFREPPNPFLAFLSKTAIYKAAKKVGRMLASGEPLDPVAGKLAQKRQQFARYEAGGFGSFANDFYDYDVALWPDEPASRLQVALMRAVLARGKEIAEAAGARLIVMIEPSARDLTTNARPNYTDYSRYRNYRRRNLSDLAYEAATASGIETINLYDAFLANDPSSLYFRENDTHWNDAGQDLAARVVARYLEEHPDPI